MSVVQAAKRVRELRAKRPKLGSIDLCTVEKPEAFALWLVDGLDLLANPRGRSRRHESAQQFASNDGEFVDF
jgi:hypothetical protein